MADRACAAPRPWLLALPIPHGPWRCLIYLWTYGPHWRPDDPLPDSGAVIAWPSKATIARDLNVPKNTVNGWIVKLTKLAWIRRSEDGWALAVGTPFDQGGIAGDQDPIQLDPDPAGPRDRTGSDPDPAGSGGGIAGDHRGDPAGSPDPTVILQGSSKDPSRPTVQRSIFGDDLEIVAASDTDKPTAAQLRVAWAAVNRRRSELSDRFSLGLRDVALTDSRMRELRARLREHVPDLPWSTPDDSPSQLGAIEHVVRVSSAQCEALRGGRTRPSERCPDGWLSSDGLNPDHWLRAKNFGRYIAQPSAPVAAAGPAKNPDGTYRRIVLTPEEREAMGPMPVGYRRGMWQESNS